jgi:hypothetical protein
VAWQKDCAKFRCHDCGHTLVLKPNDHNVYVFYGPDILAAFTDEVEPLFPPSQN